MLAEEYSPSAATLNMDSGWRGVFEGLSANTIERELLVLFAASNVGSAEKRRRINSAAVVDWAELPGDAFRA